MTDECLLAVAFQDPEFKDQAEKFAHQLSLPLVPYPLKNTLVTPNDERGNIAYFLVFAPAQNNQYQIELVKNQKPYPRLCINFLEGNTAYRIRQSTSVAQPLAKALGVKQGAGTHIIDATAGLARDAVVLACFGCQLELIERSPIIAALLQDGLRRLSLASSKNQRLSERMHLHIGDAKFLIPHICQNMCVEAIYLDPMYPTRTKQALVKKEMRMIRDIVGEDTDISELFEIALNSNLRRVVVKRPRNALSLKGPKPSHAITSKNTRYDVYLNY